MNQPPPPIPRPPADPDADPEAQQRYLDAVANWDTLVQEGGPGTSAAHIDCLPSPLKRMNNQDLRSTIDGEEKSATAAKDNIGDDDNADATKNNHTDDPDDDDEYAEAAADVIDNFGDEEVTEIKKKKKGTAFRSDEYVILAKSYMQHSEDALAGTDQKGSTFWKKVATSYNKLVAKTNSINEALISYKPMEERSSKSLTSCWNKRLQKAVSKFAGIVATNPPSSGQVRDDKKMDLYYSSMRQIYYERSAEVPGIPRKFDEVMQAYKFLKDHSKFLVCFPQGEPPLSAKKMPKMSKASKSVPPRKERPAGRDTEKAKSKVNLVAGQVTSQLKESLLSQKPSNETSAYMTKLTDLIARGNDTMESIQQHQIMAMAPSPLKKKYFDDLMAANALNAKNKRQKLELEQQKLLLEEEELKVRQLELANRKKAALDNSAIDVNESAEEHAKKCCYPDCPESDQDNVNECGGKECKHGLLFHHSCQVAYEAAHGKESTVKRCYECAQFFVMGIEEY